jgi:hypothetical protein
MRDKEFSNRIDTCTTANKILAVKVSLDSYDNHQAVQENNMNVTYQGNCFIGWILA